MVSELEKVFERVSKLDTKMQSDLAFFWEQEIENEINFDSKLTTSISTLNELANNALIEFENGNTLEKGFDEL